MATHATHVNKTTPARHRRQRRATCVPPPLRSPRPPRSLRDVCPVRPHVGHRRLQAVPSHLCRGHRVQPDRVEHRRAQWCVLCLSLPHPPHLIATSREQSTGTKRSRAYLAATRATVATSSHCASSPRAWLAMRCECPELISPASSPPYWISYIFLYFSSRNP